ncbi:FAD-dependent monooxygenase [Patescibacteria group bacterium]|nr:FAD-dependent monooxygenase [Patescibacteria group bacterium]
MEDVIIVGAGPAGLACALRLAESGISPLVLEKSKEFGRKPCGEMVTESCFNFSICDFLDKRIIERKSIVLDSWKRLTKNLRVSNIQGAFIPSVLPKKIYEKNIFLVGDSCSQVIPFTYGGLNFSLISALLISEAIIKNKPEQYWLNWKKVFYRPMLLSYLKKKLFYNFFMNRKNLPEKVIRWFW